LIGADIYTADAFDMVEMRGVFTVWPVHPTADVAVLNEHLHEHPTLPALRDPTSGRAFQWSDFTTFRQFRQTALYHDFFREQEIRHQLAITFPMGQASGALVFNRRRPDFSEEEGALLELVRPHLEQSWRRLQGQKQLEEALSWMTLAGDDQAVLALAEDGTVLFASEVATRLGRDLFGQAPPVWAPRILRKWRAERREAEDSFTVSSRGRHLSIKVVGPAEFPPASQMPGALPPGRRGYVLRLSERVAAPSTHLARRFGLTPREAEVFFWIAQGKRNLEIATILGAKPRTIEKHVENLIAKLGAESRGAAAAMAWEG
jgi:DNA-binding CsgD family transcriptional regulator